MSELNELIRPFPGRYIEDDGRGNSYVAHHIVTQRLIHIFNRPPKIELLREIYDGEQLSGVVMRLTVPGFDPIEEAGEADNPQAKTNGARLKSAASDAVKRCAMRLGLGLHLWAQEHYFLADALSGANQAGSEQSEPKAASEEGSGPGAVASPPTNQSGSGNEVESRARVWGSTREPSPPSDSPAQQSLGEEADGSPPPGSASLSENSQDGITPGDVRLVASKVGPKYNDKVDAIRQKFHVPRDIAVQWLQSAERLAKK